MEQAQTGQIKSRESTLYPGIRKWMERHFRCFKSAINVGLQYSRADVFGVRDIGGVLSGEVETICIEVKRGTEPFATACGQTLGYSVYANRVYLADRRSHDFGPAEFEIASHLGIGLIRVRGRGGKLCEEVLSGPFHNPIARMSLELMAKLGLAKCQLCGSVFESGRDKHNWLSNVVASKPGSDLAGRKKLKRAVHTNKGLVYWLQKLSKRKASLGIAHGLPGFEGTFEKRLICRDCIDALFGPLLAVKQE